MAHDRVDSALSNGVLSAMRVSGSTDVCVPSYRGLRFGDCVR